MSIDSKSGYRPTGVWIGPNGSFKEGELPGEYISNGSFSIKTPQLYSNFFPTIARMVFKLTPIMDLQTAPIRGPIFRSPEFRYNYEI